MDKCMGTVWSALMPWAAPRGPLVGTSLTLALVCEHITDVVRLQMPRCWSRCWALDAVSADRRLASRRGSRTTLGKALWQAAQR